MNENPTANNDDEKAGQGEAGQDIAQPDDAAPSAPPVQSERRNTLLGPLGRLPIPTFGRLWSYIAIRASRIAFRIYGGFVILVIATILAGVVGWLALNNVEGIQDGVNNRAIPQ